MQHTTNRILTKTSHRMAVAIKPGAVLMNRAVPTLVTDVRTAGRFVLLDTVDGVVKADRFQFVKVS